MQTTWKTRVPPSQFKCFTSPPRRKKQKKGSKKKKATTPIAFQRPPTHRFFLTNYHVVFPEEYESGNKDEPAHPPQDKQEPQELQKSPPDSLEEPPKKSSPTSDEHKADTLTLQFLQDAVMKDVEATVVHGDPDLDLCLLRVRADQVETLTNFEFGGMAGVGQMIVVLGWDVDEIHPMMKHGVISGPTSTVRNGQLLDCARQQWVFRWTRVDGCRTQSCWCFGHVQFTCQWSHRDHHDRSIQLTLVTFWKRQRRNPVWNKFLCVCVCVVYVCVCVKLNAIVCVCACAMAMCNVWVCVVCRLLLN